MAPGGETAGRKPSEMSARELYIDLLIRALPNILYGDAPLPGRIRRHRFDLAKRWTGVDWPSQAHTMVGVERLRNLATLVQSCLDDKIPGDFIETGVWRGGCCILMQGVLAANGVADRRIYVADSFRGLPPPQVDQDAGSRYHQLHQLRISRDQVAANFEKYGLLDDNVVFAEGWFRDTLPALQADRFALIRLDGDMYDSTMVALENLYPKLAPGGYVIIDDYGLDTCRHAVTDYREAHQITDPIRKVDWTGAWWRKVDPTSAIGRA
jgi:O-methyltransferase/8-demethyl-8-(2,3-dimethoxy-alpha-L-rhamnosyl)tetracenomycin-C 4'-O-methyltransferase